jgi:phosphatidate cytidylyltransferase
MLAQRAAVAAVGVPVIVGLILIGGPLYAAVVGIFLVIAALEFYAATDPEAPGGPVTRQRLPGLAAAAAVALRVLAADNGFEWWARALALAVALPFLPSILFGRPETGLRDWLWSAGGVIYVGYLGAHFVFLRDAPKGEEWVLLAVFGTFATDTAAYFVGRAVGRTKLAPAISPGKTVEGSLGGIAGGAAAVIALNWLLDTDAGWDIVPLALLLPVVAELGDLAESMIKRGAGVKDTSHALPGHGGILDRLDSLLFTVPLVYYYLTWLIL